MHPDASSYNATVTRICPIHEELLVMWVRPDFGRLEHLPGQYATLGLGTWEPRVECDESLDGLEPQIIRRAYSISHSPVDEAGNLVRPGQSEELEFYVSLVRKSKAGRPMLTPRIFRLEPGRRIFVHPHIHGAYTLASLPRACDVLFAATGTGEAPHNMMIAELLARGHQGRIASLVCVRQRRDLSYAKAHFQLAKRYPNYRYMPLTTREPENLDSSHPGFVGKRYVQNVLVAADAEGMLGFPLSPATCHVFLCGNPDMIGLVADSTEIQPAGAIAALEQQGFTIDSPARPGNIHFERYF